MYSYPHLGARRHEIQGSLHSLHSVEMMIWKKTDLYVDTSLVGQLQFMPMVVPSAM